MILRDSAGDGGKDIVEELRAHVAKEIGKIARPRQIMVVPELPKTRSGKIMRRLLRDVAEDREVGDVTTLADSTVMNLISDNLKDGSGDGRLRPSSAATAGCRSAWSGSLGHPRRHHEPRIRPHRPHRRPRSDVPSKDDPTIGRLVADATP